LRKRHAVAGVPDTETVTPAKKSWRERVKQYYSILDNALSMSKNIAATALAVWAYVYGCGGSSHTSFRFAEASGDVIKLNVTTKAPKLKSAYLREFYVSFSNLPIEDTHLRLVSENVDRAWSIVRDDESVIVRLTADRLRTRCRQRTLDGQSDRFTKEEILSGVDSGQATFTVAVQESSDNDTQRHRIVQVVPAKALEEFIDHYLPDNTPARTSC
jgi:hypothetical protein